MSNDNGNQIQVQMRIVFGTPRVYPICERAKIFAKLGGRKTLTERVLNAIVELGYELDYIPMGVNI